MVAPTGEPSVKPPSQDGVLSKASKSWKAMKQRGMDYANHNIGNTPEGRAKREKENLRSAAKAYEERMGGKKQPKRARR